MFKKLFSFEGRIRRLEFALSFLIYILCFFISGGLIFFIQDTIVFFVVMLPLWWFMITQSVKRCHDIGHSGWFLFIPFYNFLLFFWEGESEGNKYGPNPKTGKDGFVPDKDIEIDSPLIEKIEETKVYVNYTYNSDLGELVIEQELSQPNVGEFAFMDGKPAHSNKYKVGFMNYIHVENGRIVEITML